MFKRICIAMFKEENYIDTLSYLSKRIDAKATYEAKENEFDRIDEVLWNLACKADETEQALRIVTALRIAVDSCYYED